MQQLDEWTQESIIDPLREAWEDAERAPDEYLEDAQKDLLNVVANVKRSVREKVLDSYRNGQNAGRQREWRGKNKQQK